MMHWIVNIIAIWTPENGEDGIHDMTYLGQSQSYGCFEVFFNNTKNKYAIKHNVIW